MPEKQPELQLLVINLDFLVTCACCYGNNTIKSKAAGRTE
jgi:hypothetical protein